MGSVYDLAFPAVDQATVDQLRGTGFTGSVENLKQRVYSDETGSFYNALNAADTSSRTTTQYGLLLSRNRTISDMARNQISQNKTLNKAAKDTFTRQGEINEWSAQNKLDTLFFLQVLFLFFTAAVVLVYLRQADILPSTAMYILLGILLVIVIGTFWNRASYTLGNRDKRYWNRRFIGLDDGGSGLTAQLQCQLS